MRFDRRIVQVEVPAAAAELAADVLWQAGPSAVSQADLDGGLVLLTADVASTDRIVGLPISATMRIVELDSDDHLDLWRGWATPVRAGRTVVLHPAWVPRGDDLSDRDVVLLIDPGRAFGSGAHASTRLVVAALEAHLRRGDRVLDVGTGSGVLAVAACALGASHVVAIDVDPIAIRVTEANASANGVAGCISVSTTPLALVSGAFDAVVANIGAGTLRALAGDICARLAPNGLLILSGLLEAQADAVVAEFHGCVELDRPMGDGWVASILRSSA